MWFGSHNSGSNGPLQGGGCVDCMVSPWTQNQTLTIEEQIAQGVRWFDLRISVRDSVLYLSHTYLTENKLDDVFAVFRREAVHRPETSPGDTRPGPEWYVNLRIDFQQRDQVDTIQPLLRPLIDVLVADESVGACILLYCDDGTVTHAAVRSTGLMPTVSFWDAGTIDECERRFQQLDTLFQDQCNGPFLFPKERMLLLDYSTSAPLWYTDRQQFDLLKKYRDTVRAARLTILAGNHVEQLIDYAALAFAADP